MVLSLLLIAGVTLAQTPENPNNVPDYAREAQSCSRVDLRPALENVGLDPIRNRGGRLDNFSFAFSEMLSLAKGEPVSARWLEHWLEDHQVSGLRETQTAVRAFLAGRLRPCLESAVKSEDVESTRLARLRRLAQAHADLNPSLQFLFKLFGTDAFASASITPFSCREAERISAKPRASLTLTETKGIDAIDRSLRAGRLPIAFADLTYAVSGRRLSASSGRCEYLVRTYEGPLCSKGICEDGSFWIERDEFRKSVTKVWSLEP